MSNIEKKGVGWLETRVADSKLLDPYFRENDKTPSWDGTIIVYDGSMKKENIKGKIDVQIKTTEVDKFHSNKTSYQVNIVDYENYYKIRGTILFVVEICGTDRKIFIKSLLPSEIKHILDELKNNGKSSKMLHLDELDMSTTKQLESICEHFLVHQKLQYIPITVTNFRF
mgnify:CR=1 FL=1|jgi:hypothetical protein